MPSVCLIPHPQAPCAAVTEIAVWAGIEAPDRLRLHYRIAGAMDRLRIPPLGPGAFAEGLWAHTCCEAFIQVAGDGGYWEWNLAPSTQWALYRFAGYRRGMTPLLDTGPPRVGVRCETQGLELEASLDLGRLPLPSESTSLELGLSAVIEEADGRLSYWALHHPQDRPDFHHPASFRLQLPLGG